MVAPNPGDRLYLHSAQQGSALCPGSPPSTTHTSSQSPLSTCDTETLTAPPLLQRSKVRHGNRIRPTEPRSLRAGVRAQADLALNPKRSPRLQSHSNSSVSAGLTDHAHTGG